MGRYSAVSCETGLCPSEDVLANSSTCTVRDLDDAEVGV